MVNGLCLPGLFDIEEVFEGFGYDDQRWFVDMLVCGVAETTEEHRGCEIALCAQVQ